MPRLRTQNSELGLGTQRNILRGRRSPRPWVLRLVSSILVVAAGTPDAPAITSRTHRHVSGQELSRGDVNDVVVGSRGTIQLGHAAKTLIDRLEGAWSVNSLVVSGGTVYLGTGPNGAVYEYSMGQCRKVYPAADQGADPNQATFGEPNRVTNEHVFAMAADSAGRLLVGLSGSKARLVRLTDRGPETLCEIPDSRYVFALAVDEAGTVFLGTGPEGKIYQLPALAERPELVYDCPDKNILSLAIGADGSLYAGTDSRGLIYRIHPKDRDRTASILFDGPQPEITGLVLAESAFADGLDLYAVATSARLAPPERAESRTASSLPGRPEPSRPAGDTPDPERTSSRSLQVANTKKETASEGPPPRTPLVRRPDRPDTASRLVRVTRDGYTTEVAGENAVFFCLGHVGKRLLIGTGNEARLLRVDPVLEQQSILYQDEQASQITSLAVSNGEVLVGTANPAKLVRIDATYAREGVYTSTLVDADQPAHWGRLQIDADLPAGCKVLAACRSGNVEDVNDPTFSAWTDPVEITGPVPLTCPVGRFCQYRLTLQSLQGDATPLIREVTVSSTIPNLAPVVDSVDVSRISSPASKQGLYRIAFKTRDGNDDEMTYTLDFRRAGREPWIQLEEDLDEETFEWDGRTVEDGRYEIRVTASDARSNTPSTQRTGSRISDPVVVDNTGPAIRSTAVERTGKTATVVLTVADQFSAIGRLEYTVDSNKDWQGAVPEDGVYDTTEETLTIRLEDLSAGEHVLAVKVSDDLDNTTYRSFDLKDAGQP